MIFVALALLSTLIIPPLTDEPPLELTPWLYDPPNYIFFSNDNPAPRSPAAAYVDQLLSKPSHGTKCVANNPKK